MSAAMHDIIMSFANEVKKILGNEKQFNYWLGALPFYNNVQREGMVLNG